MAEGEGGTEKDLNCVTSFINDPCMHEQFKQEKLLKRREEITNYKNKVGVKVEANKSFLS